MQFQELNSSVATLLHAFDAAPFLKTLPEEVSNVQNKVAQFGSRLTDLETQFTKSETDLKSDLDDLKHNLAKNDKVTCRLIIESIFLLIELIRHVIQFNFSLISF